MAHRAEYNPIHNYDIIYTPDVLVFKSDTVKPELMDEVKAEFAENKKKFK